MLLALADLVEWRLGDVDVAVLDERLHVAVEEREEQRADVGAVDIRISHDDDLAVTALREVEVLADARAEGRDHRADLGIGEDLVESCLLDVEDLAAQRQDGLEAAVAALLGGAACGITLDEVDLGLLRIFDGAVGELARQARHLEGVLAARELACLAGGFARTGGHDGLLDDALRDGRVLVEVLGEALRDDRVDDAADLGVAELRLRLALKLRLADLEADDTGQALAHIVAREVGVLVLEDALLAREVIGCARQRELEAGEVRAALFRVDVVDEGVDILLVTVVVLHGDLDDSCVLDAVEVDGLGVQHFFLAVEVLDERADAALEVERLTADRLDALVVQADRDAVVEEGELAQAMAQRLVAVRRDREDLRVRHEVDARTRLRRRADDCQRLRRHAALEGDLVDLAVALDLDFHARRQGVDDGNADAVQAARHLVAVAAELAARVQDGQDDLDGRLAALVHVDRDAAAVVDDRDAVVLVDRHVDVVAVAGERLIDGVVDDLVDEMVQAALARAADVHARAHADGLEPLEDLDLLGAVVGLDSRDFGARLIRVDLDARRVEVLIREVLGLLLRRRSSLRLVIRRQSQVDGFLIVIVCHKNSLLPFSRYLPIS